MYFNDGVVEFLLSCYIAMAVTCAPYDSDNNDTLVASVSGWKWIGKSRKVIHNFMSKTHTAWWSCLMLYLNVYVTCICIDMCFVYGFMVTALTSICLLFVYAENTLS